MRFIENVDKIEYQNFSQNHEKSHFLQSYEWGEFCRDARNQIPHYVGMKDDREQLVATALILEKKTPLGYSYGYCPRGFLIDYKNKAYLKVFTNYLKKFLKEKKFIYLKIDPDLKYQDIDENALPINSDNNNYPLFDYLQSLGYIHGGFYKLYEGNQPRYTFRINLKDENIESKFSKSFMKSIKRSYQYDLIIDHKPNVNIFYELMKNNSEKDNFDPRSEKYYQLFQDNLNEFTKFYNISIKPQELLKKINNEINNYKELLEKNSKRNEDIKNKINRLEKEKEIFQNIKEEQVVVCSLICIYTKNRAWSLYIGSNEIANLTFAVSRSYYEAIMDAKNNNYDFFDLFGTVGNPNTTYKNLAKLHDFKRKFGDEYIEFIGEFDLVNKKILYKLLPIMLKIYRKLRG
ncbi:MAG: aminoacyltransferase [Firmicutes bacterium]|nr:aminoacyltransferase [Bacillota bacterium]